jgi:hypothetical protein
MKDVTAVTLPKRRLVRRSAQQWRALIEAQARSGLSIAAFCRARGVCIGSMDNWRKRLRAEDSRPEAVELSPPAFVEIAQPMRALDAGVKLRLELGGGVVLELSRL